MPPDPQAKQGVGGHQQIVEFFGMPGTGKTTTSLLMKEKLGSDGGRFLHCQTLDGSHLSGVRRNLRRLGLIASELPRTLFQLPVLFAVFRIPQRSLKDRIKAVYNIWTLRSVLSRASSSGRHLILDQGPLQAVWSLFLASSEQDIERWIDRLAPNGSAEWHIVILTANTSVLLERLGQRPGQHSRLEHDTNGGTSQSWVRGEHLVDQITEALEKLIISRQVTLTVMPTDNNTPTEIVEGLFKRATI